jgi:hypothetical protein
MAAALAGAAALGAAGGDVEAGYPRVQLCNAGQEATPFEEQARHWLTGHPPGSAMGDAIDAVPAATDIRSAEQCAWALCIIAVREGPRHRAAHDEAGLREAEAGGYLHGYRPGRRAAGRVAE